MLRDKVFAIFLVFSVAVHTAFLISLPPSAINPNKNVSRKIEVVYQKDTSVKKEGIKVSEARRVEPVKRAEALSIAKNPPPDFSDYFPKPKLQAGAINKPQAYNDKLVAIKPRRVELLLEKAVSGNDNLPKNPLYLKYYEATRGEIRRYAYYNVVEHLVPNYSRAYSGEVCLYFTIVSDGSLKELRVIDDKSTQDNYLKEIAMRSIKDAAPFPVIPKELDYPELSFTIIISFDLE
ncbi:MAG: TonB family protein [Candidatus Omnitrophota bacterium]|nr:TonB family protein [Candidatus Omnitrophota bacterium]